MQIILSFVEDMRVTVCARDLGLSRTTVTNYYDNLRGCYADALEDDPPLGTSLGPYECDEFHVKHVRSRGDVFIDLWIQDVYERETGLYIARIVPNRSAEVLEQLIGEVIPPQSLIFSDDWAGYHRLNRLGYRHHSVTHSADEYARTEVIEGKEMEVHINTIEGIHSSLRSRLKKKSNRNVERVELILKEFTYRHSSRSQFIPFKINRD
jgi:IS1 family transposase